MISFTKITSLISFKNLPLQNLQANFIQTWPKWFIWVMNLRWLNTSFMRDYSKFYQNCLNVLTSFALLFLLLDVFQMTNVVHIAYVYNRRKFGLNAQKLSLQYHIWVVFGKLTHFEILYALRKGLFQQQYFYRNGKKFLEKFNFSTAMATISYKKTFLNQRWPNVFSIASESIWSCL